MNSDLEHRVEDLEERIQRLEGQRAEELKQADRLRRRATWTRIGFLIVVALTYVLYLGYVSSIL